MEQQEADRRDGRDDTHNVRVRDRPALCTALAALLVLALTACSDDAPTAGGTEPRPSDTGVPTITVSALPEPPPTDTLIADMRQSSRDAAAGRMEVWIDNDTLEDVTPTRITYFDDRFRTPLTGERLREIPAQSTRGFQFYLPPRPTCGSSNDVPVSLENPLGTVLVEYAATKERLKVADETDVAGRFTRARCLELAIAEVAALSWADQVTPGDPTETPVGDEGTLTLVLDTTGTGGHELTIDTVSGTPILSPAGTDAWRPAFTISGDQPSATLDLPLKPTRCDAHAFAESGGATAFKIGLHLDGEPGQITLRMSPAGAANAINYARASCGLLETVDGGVEG
jgi:hypothetical protein